MKNVQMTMDKDGILTIKIDTKQEHGLTGSGKNIIVASSCGNVTIDGTNGIKIGINCYKKAPDVF